MHFRIVLICLSLAYLAPTPASSQQTSEEQKQKSKINSGLLSAFKLRNIGPALMSGRIGDIAVDPSNPNTWYVGVASGNLWKTTNAGTTWKPIFENYGSYSIGCVTVDPNNPNTIWVGTGENNGGRHIGYGDGVYVSHDGGKSFKNMGLKETEHIGKIIVHPRNPKIIWVAAQGPLWSPGRQRGLFKSTDGGQTWKNVLSAGQWTGVSDAAIDPKNPNTLYASTHQRHRTVWALMNTGPESGIHKSVDGGETWTELKKGLPSANKGKISLQVSPQKSNVVYATIELDGREGGFYRTDDSGASWSKMSDYLGGGTGPHYYQEIYVDPHRFDVIYQANVQLGRSSDGGKTWDNIEGQAKHVDNHAVVFHPTDPNFVLVGCDGGLYVSYDNAKTYRFINNLPLTQFYKIDVDYDFPFYHVVGGTQDNYTQYGPTRTGNVQGIRTSDWKITIGGDGHDNAIDPTDPNIIYCESQQGFIRRYDRKTGESIDIRPQPGAGEEGFRFNWDSPILLSPHNPKRIYFGSKFLHRSDDQGDSWTKVSPDLSRQQNRFALPMMGRVWSVDAGYDLMAMSRYGNITSISESPLVEGLLYVGTDDGLIQISEDGGKNWRAVEKIFGVPENFFVNDIKADLHDPNTVYAVMDDHKTGDYQPYLAKSKDRGKTWELMTGDLPDRHLLWRIVQDHENPDLFFLGTEFGIYCTLNSGKNWHKLQSGAPAIPFRDLAVQTRENDLVGASFGRGIYVLDDYSPLRELNDKLLADNELYLFPIRKALWYLPSDSLGGPRGFQGDSFFATPNPDFGATFTYYVRDNYKTAKQQRKESEAKANQSGSDVTVPSWNELEEEKLEEPVKVFFEVHDSEGNRVARVDGAASQGLHRGSWNLRQTSQSGRGGGPMVAPGTYSLQGFKSDNGKTTELGPRRDIEVVSIVEPSLKPQQREDVIAFHKQAAKLSDAVNATSQSLSDAVQRIEAMRGAISRSTAGTPEIAKAAHDLQKSLNQAESQLNGDSVGASKYEQTIPTIGGRVRNALSGTVGNTYGVTQTQREQLAIAEKEFIVELPRIRDLLEVDMRLFEQKLEEAGIPWTPGRPIPDYK